MRVEKALLSDINELMACYELARNRMINEGNLTQWDNKVVFEKEIEEYINRNLLYKVLSNDEIVGCFAYILTGDNAYSIIKGNWLNNSKYVTIHKIMSKYNNKGIGSFMIDIVKNMAINDGIYNIKIDTHKNNISMNKFLINKGFKLCGLISLNLDFTDEYSIRNAYQFVI